ncbi:MAG TPA: cytochrome c [Verrucomicrobiae bacterium]|nr:cytochrome c [Verrucomicrobiae bacterium]
MKLSVIRLALLSVGLAAFFATSVRADAQKTYQSKCSACHGADGKGDTGAGKALGAHDFASPEVKKMTDAEMAGIISNGKGKMPAYGKSLSAAEIKDLVDYIRGLAKK